MIITSGVDDFGEVEIKSAPANMSQYIWEHIEKREENRIKKKKKKNLMPSSRIVFEISELTHYKKNCEFCVAEAILL